MHRSFVRMNYLGHAYLSFGSSSILAGNMISDFVKGNSKFLFSSTIQKGIILHRQIDEFTDHHIAIKNAKEVFRPSYRLYSGAITDVLLDYFLANDASVFNAVSLKDFASKTYSDLEKHSFELPVRFVQMLAYMKAEDWLYNYKYTDGIQKSLEGLCRRAVYIKESQTAFILFLKHSDFLNHCYREFFPDVKQFAKQKFEELLS